MKILNRDGFFLKNYKYLLLHARWRQFRFDCRHWRLSMLTTFYDLFIDYFNCNWIYKSSSKIDCDCWPLIFVLWTKYSNLSILRTQYRSILSISNWQKWPSTWSNQKLGNRQTKVDRFRPFLAPKYLNDPSKWR